ncbi:MAG: tRNA pseudouridine(38-40) synthase TruA [Flavobacteriaceae bacterium]|nr:tRNA pseudouridine(38-40) synthase TruA [Flavobacteriaceae bacterium]
MFSKRYFYLIEFQYLGFRYHGWQKQPNVITVEYMVSRTMSYILGHKKFKLLTAGRTDAKVSANSAYVELFLDGDPIVLNEFLPLLNKNLPADIRALDIQEVDKQFNVIEAPLGKEYLYLFSFGSKNHPFAAPYMTAINEDLNINVMQLAAKLFEGTHDFKNYAFRPNPETKTIGTIQTSEIIENTIYTASFFPEISYVFRVKGKGFKRHQIRLMMGVLFDLGESKVNLDFIAETLEPNKAFKLERIAPASGLILNNVQL